MEQEFTISKGWKIFTYIFSIAVIGTGLYFFINALQTGKDIWLWTGLFVGMAVFFGYCTLAAYRKKIILKNDEIIKCGTFNTKRLPFSRIKGYRINDRHIILVSTESNKHNIVIDDYSYMKNSGELLVILHNRFIDLDKADYKNELDEIMHDPTIGVSVHDREQKLVAAKKTARILNTLGMVIGFWLLIYPHPYPLSIYFGLVYPVFASVFFFRKQEIFTLLDTARKSTAYPSLNSALAMPVFGLLIRAILDYDLLDYKNCIIAVVVVFIILALLFTLLIQRVKDKAANLYLGLFLFYFSVTAAQFF